MPPSLACRLPEKRNERTVAAVQRSLELPGTRTRSGNRWQGPPPIGRRARTASMCPESMGARSASPIQDTQSSRSPTLRCPVHRTTARSARFPSTNWFEAHGIGRREFKVMQVEAPQFVGATRATSQKASLQHAPSSMSVRMSASSNALTVWPVGLPASQTPFGV